MAIEDAERVTADRLAKFRRHLDHLQELRPRVTSAETLRRDLTLHNDVLYSLLAVCQLLIDIAGDLAGRRGQRFDNYTEAVRSLTAYPEFPDRLVRDLEPLPGLRRVLLEDCVARDLDRVIPALELLPPLEEFAEGVLRLESRHGDA
ncbi:MAG TPA: hypothetical protein VNJ70_06455 [Thermoanaerobaculia bacterium]|nr:hypothetical protein [Thermoanaerobaculia bacterium]